MFHTFLTGGSNKFGTAEKEADCETRWNETKLKGPTTKKTNGLFSGQTTQVFSVSTFCTARFVADVCFVQDTLVPGIFEGFDIAPHL